VRYEALFAAAFVAGLLGAMSQQGVAPQTRKAHTMNGPMSMAAAAPGPQLVIPLMPEPGPVKLADASAGPVTAKEVAAEAKPVKKVKVARKAKPKAPEVAAAAPPPEPESHGFFYRLFHKSADAERVATADSRS